MPSRDSVHRCTPNAADVKDEVRTYRLSYEAWLTGRNVDASEKDVATRVLVFDFELFMGVH